MKTKKYFGISSQIQYSYLFIMITVFGAGAFAIFLIHRNNQLDKQIVEVNFPLQEQLVQYQALVDNSFDLTNNWIFNPNLAAKKRLRFILDKEVDDNKNNINNIALKLPSLREPVMSTFARVDSLFWLEKKIVSLLQTEDDYIDDMKVEEAITLYETDLTEKKDNVDALLIKFIEDRKVELRAAQEEKANANSVIFFVLLTTFLLTAVVSVIASVYTKRQVVKPIINLKRTLYALAQGEIVTVESRKNRDEIHEMIEAMQSLTAGLEKKINFAYEIGKGNYHQEFEQLSEKDSMGIALIKMRDSLKQNDEESSKRTWAATGQAEIAEVLRNQGRSLEELYDQVISFICKYTESNQGAIFLLEEDHQTQEQYLDMISCYAYDRKKHLHQRIEIGDGLVGQCFLESKIIFLTDVPESYMKITSGLGEASPTCVLISPLIINDQIFGVLELASFNVYKEHQKAFIEKVSETIASSIFNIKGNIKTQSLLEDSRIQATQLKEKEEELQQNLEELRATQEQLEREKMELLKNQTPQQS
ncbi:GAF domain-containing protein [Persicobacter psychrovividus]|uniref:HAMP domain-containing protein n=1 Tax=Persicobacter psychrovividus TaxID=387638 RepID=A0ABM7VIX3_9BACT|nr:hypothetical protein PEPS_31830 [Persicobacter psychrovividus]